MNVYRSSTTMQVDAKYKAVKSCIGITGRSSAGRHSPQTVFGDYLHGFAA
jgi:hypothetical protein